MSTRKQQVFIKVDENNYIMAVESSAFYNEKQLLADGYILIDEGIDGYVYGHAQPNYLREMYGKPTFDEYGRYNFKYIDSIIQLIPESEKINLNSIVKYTPTEQEKINATLIKENAEMKKELEIIKKQIGANANV